MTAESVERYMNANMILNVSEAVNDIAYTNNIDINKISIVGYFDEDYDISVSESTEVMLEKAAEDNAMTLKQAESYYKTVLKTCKSKAESAEQIDDCIKILKICKKDMEKALKSAKSDLLDGGRIKYALKSLIPFNNIWRLFKRNDWTAGITAGAKGLSNATFFVIGAKAGTDVVKGMLTDNIGGVAKGTSLAAKAGAVATPIGNALTVGSVVVRLATYESMLERNIKSTDEAISYLENKKKKLQD